MLFISSSLAPHMRCLQWDADEVSILLELEPSMLGRMMLRRGRVDGGSREPTDSERKRDEKTEKGFQKD